MRRLFLLSAMLLSVISIMAQYEPNTNWPYLYENFTKGTVYSADNTKSSMAINIHLAGNVLHYVGTDGRVYQAKDNDIIRVEIGNDAYIVQNNRMMQLIAAQGNNVLLKLSEADFGRAETANGGAYGSDLNSSASTKMNTLEIGTFTPELGKMLQEKNDGAEIAVSVKYFYVLNGKLIEANKGAVEKYVGKEKEADLKAFMKTNKIKWKNQDSLKAVLEYLSK